MMNQRNVLQKITAGLLLMLLWALVFPVLAQENELAITAKQNLALQSKPDYDSDVLGVFQRGEQATAFGRDEAGGWLHIAEGWVIAKNVETAGDIMTLPVTTDAVTVKAAGKRFLRSGPDDSFDVTGDLPGGEAALALGRNGGGSWLEVSSGWLPADQVAISGDVMALPITFSSITITASQNAALHRGPSRDTEVDAILERGESLIATNRNEAGTAVQTPKGWVFVSRGLQLDGEVMDLPPVHTVSVTAAQDLTSYRSPGWGFEPLVAVEQGEQAIAFGRDETGIWLQIPGGWVSAEQGLETRGDIMGLPITGHAGITITPSYSGLTVRGGPSVASDIVRSLQKGEVLAIGRNEKGTWLQIESGWVYAAAARADGDIMDLPVTSGESSRAVSSTTTSARRATPTPARSSSSAFNGQTIRSQVSRYTDDIRILKISQRGSTTSIEYDLKSWFLVPNESIAKEVVFKMICALRRGGQIPHKLEFVGQGNFKSDVGRKFRSPSVEIHISAINANRIVCSGNNYTDINWRSLSSFYKSYPVPRGATVDD